MLTQDGRDRVHAMAMSLAEDGDHGNADAALLLDLLRTDAAYQEMVRQNYNLRQQLDDH